MQNVQFTGEWIGIFQPLEVLSPSMIFAWRRGAQINCQFGFSRSTNSGIAKNFFSTFFCICWLAEDFLAGLFGWQGLYLHFSTCGWLAEGLLAEFFGWQGFASAGWLYSFWHNFLVGKDLFSFFIHLLVG